MSSPEAAVIAKFLRLYNFEARYRQIGYDNWHPSSFKIVGLLSGSYPNSGPNSLIFLFEFADLCKRKRMFCSGNLKNGQKEGRLDHPRKPFVIWGKLNQAQMGAL